MHCTLNYAQSNSTGSKYYNRRSLLNLDCIDHGPKTSHDTRAKNGRRRKWNINFDPNHRPLRYDGVRSHFTKIERSIERQCPETKALVGNARLMFADVLGAGPALKAIATKKS
jgi:hypothetical protein